MIGRFRLGRPSLWRESADGATLEPQLAILPGRMSDDAVDSIARVMQEFVEQRSPMLRTTPRTSLVDSAAGQAKRIGVDPTAAPGMPTSKHLSMQK